MKAKLVSLALGVAVSVGVVGALAMSPEPLEPETPLAPPDVEGGVKAVLRSRVFFLHMSVGEDILAGVKALGVSVRVTRRTGAEPLAEGAITEQFFGHNGSAVRKLEEAEELVKALPNPPHAVLVKLCFADFDERTDIDAVLARYKRLVGAVRERFPETRLVHVTVPILHVATGLRDTFKRLTGVGDHSARSNMVRSRFNAALRAAYPGDVLFDLERVETSTGDGRRAVFTRDRRRWPNLFADNARDGAHLSLAGSRLAGAALLDALARALGGVQ